MNAEDFSRIVEARLAACLKTLTKKAREYAGDEDRLENFKRAAALQNVEPETALMGMWAKHLVSLTMIVEELEMGRNVPSPEMVAEKVTDTINYAILLEGLIEDRREMGLDDVESAVADLPPGGFFRIPRV